MLTIIERGGKPFINVDHRRISMYLPPETTLEKRAELIHEWHKVLLHQAIPSLIAK